MDQALKTLIQVKSGSDLFTDAENITSLAENIVKSVKEHHRLHPAEVGMVLETARSKLEQRGAGELFDLAVESARDANVLILDEGRLATPEFSKSSGPGAERVATRVLEALAGAGLGGLSEAAVHKILAQETSPVLKNALSRLTKQGTARRLGELWFAESNLDELRAKVIARLADGNKMSVVEFKEIAGVGRKQAIPLLEQLDREGTTRRTGDDRVLGSRGKS